MHELSQRLDEVYFVSLNVDRAGVVPEPIISAVTQEVRTYLGECVRFIRSPQLAVSGGIPEKDPAGQVYRILTSPEFTYLSRSRSDRFKETVMQKLHGFVEAKKPAEFYLDLGGGYHAATETESWRLSFTPGVGELLVLYQICRFRAKVLQVYPPGVKFWIVIDNVVANFVNDVPISRTLGYCNAFRRLIAWLGLESFLELLVESEVADWRERAHQLRYSPGESLSADQRHNVARFLGRPCSRAEALDRLAWYGPATAQSERLLSKFTDRGVHLTQRESANCPAFRSFPGGASRLQTGEVGFRRNHLLRLVPYLITTQTRQQIVPVHIALKDLNL